jgi:hypothetical protein
MTFFNQSNNHLSKTKTVQTRQNGKTNRELIGERHEKTEPLC